MKFKTTSLLAALLLMAMVSSSVADISNTAVLFLRIAPGARAAGMGEAFVAVADDATATHYNPAGLGAYPLAENWIDVRIPDEYQPIRGLAALKSRGGSNYQAYDIWAITPKGLMRFDNKKWHAGEQFNPRTDDNIEKITARYFGLEDPAAIEEAVMKVAAANNRGSQATVQAFRDSVLAVTPEDYRDRAALETALDSLVTVWEQIRIDWNRFSEAQNHLKDGMKDNALNGREIERIQFATERSRMRWMPEEIVVPYSVKFEGEPTAIASNAKDLLIGTTAGLVRFNGKSWQTFTSQSGLPSDTITTLRAMGATVYVGTTNGLARFNGLTLEKFDSTSMPPSGLVGAIGGSASNDMFMTIDNDLYHYNGQVWSNTMPYTVVIDDSVEKIAAKFAIYGSREEQQKYIEKLLAVNANLTVAADSGAAGSPMTLAPGQVIQVPYLAEIKGDVHAITSGLGKTVWLGTSHGLAVLEPEGWDMPGYQQIVIDTATTLEQLAQKRTSPLNQEQYIATLREINDLESDVVEAGQQVLVYRHSAATPVRSIDQFENKMFVATAGGLLEYDGAKWGRSDLRGLGKESSRDISLVGDEVWAASDNRIITRAQGRPEISTMYVKWLPDLADDLYFTFLSFVQSTSSWGTFGGNVSFVSYGSIERRGEDNQDLGTFDAFDVAVTGSYGTSLTNKLKGGISAKFLYSHLSEVGAGAEKGSGTATGFAIDFGLLYHVNPRLNFGLALTNLGPKMSYIDANQADDLPRNLGVGFAYKLFNSDFNRLTLTTEVNKILVGVDDGFSQEVQEVVLNTGAEWMYANLFALRGGYIFDEEGEVKVFTLGAGLAAFDKLKFDFAYIPSGQSVALSNVLRISVAFLP